jgi:hypothetical protein
MLLQSARYRIERMRGLTPFVGVLVEQLVVQLKYPDIDSSKDWFLAAGPMAGLVLPLARGEALLEAGWRAPTPGTKPIIRTPRSARCISSRAIAFASERVLADVEAEGGELAAFVKDESEAYFRSTLGLVLA